MQPAVARKVREIKGRVRDLRASFVAEIKASKIPVEKLNDPEDRLIPRVTGLVVREGNWLVRLANRLVQRSEYKADQAEQDTLANAELFFGELAEVHADEIKKNGFIYRMDADFIGYIERLVLLVEKVEALNRAKIAAVATIDDEVVNDDEIAAEIAAEMTS